MSDLHRLSGIADHAAHGAHLPPASDVRELAERRRTRRRIAGGALAVVAIVGVGVASGGIGADPDARPLQPAVSSTASDTPAPDPAPVEQTTPLLPPTDTPALDGGRELSFMPVGSGTILALGDNARREPLGAVVVGAPRVVPLSTFVPVAIAPDAEEYLLKTGSLRPGGEPLCFELDDTPRNRPLGVDDDERVVVSVVEACDTSVPGQRWRLEPAGEVEGTVAYTLDTAAGDRLSYGGVDRFHVADRGPASLPTLD